MRTNDVTPERLRALAELHPERGKVLSVFVDLDPSRFAEPRARAAMLGSLRNDAERLVEGADGLEPDELVALREDLERVRGVLDVGAVPAEGAGGLALFACGPAGLFEVLALPESVEPGVHLDDAPHVAPLAAVGADERWAIALVDRRVARILTGRPRSAGEVRSIDDETKGQHQKGGWSQARYQRSVDEEVLDHLRHVADELFALHQRRPFDHLLVAGLPETTSELEPRLHPYLQQVLRGRFEIDVQNSSEEEVRQAAREYVQRERERVEAEALARVRAGLGGERAATGLDDVLGVLNEARVEILLVPAQAEDVGRALHCPTCDWLGTGEDACPADGTPLEEVDALETLTERAVTQDAQVVALRDAGPLEAYGKVAAVLRY